MFVLAPFVTIFLSWRLADERVTIGLLAGALLVLAGMWFGALFSSDRQRQRLNQIKQES